MFIVLTWIKYTKLDVFKAISSYNSARNNVYHAQRIVVKCASRHVFRYARFESSLYYHHHTEAVRPGGRGRGYLPSQLVEAGAASAIIHQTCTLQNRTILFVHNLCVTLLTFSISSLFIVSLDSIRRSVKVRTIPREFSLSLSNSWVYGR